ncbi:LuxR C-terminal-related transcriptional regulator [Microbacterium sp. Bi121]|uniref:LuxR C-terminal-related transcriptional regulator n=1 Tax=Microbacterium sp. Bi121 TaxID=2822348 RepID=UPI001DAC6D22|nr:LuxR C-terminal-related transcriptional regulator [Microbacterium sp. Bi121]CAH0223721.1 Spore germination protein GerE [Microbacterium sp. Bi121]
MTVVSMRQDHAPHAAPVFLWNRQLRAVIETIAASPESPPRATLIGNAGSGKSASLRHLRRMLLDRGLSAELLSSPDPALIGRTPPETVLLVDDAHLLDDEQLASLRERADDASTALIVAARPWPSPESLRGIARTLERTGSSVVLGHVSPSDLIPHLEADATAMRDACLQHILQSTGGVTWLVVEALSHHDELDCIDDDAHAELQRTLAETVLHRLDTIDSAHRSTVQALCLRSAQHVPSAETDDAVRCGHAEGLLLRSGRPVPLVLSAVRASLPARRLAELSGSITVTDAESDGQGVIALAEEIGSEAVADALVRHGDRMLDTDPARAEEAYREAILCGTVPSALAARRAAGAWARGELDDAIAIADEATPDARAVDAGPLTDVAAGVWSARAMMTQADAVYRACPPQNAVSAVLATVAAVAVGSASASPAAGVDGAPSTLSVAMMLLRRGIQASIAGDASDAVLADVVRSAEMYTSSRATGAVPELPAVIAAVIALNAGATATARTVVDDAIRGAHGGSWAAPRLLLWRAWIAVQRARPADARADLARAYELAPSMSARDDLLAHAVRVAIARRYEDASGAEEAWRHARGSVLRAEIDLFLLHPLSELISSATRAGDAARVEQHFAHALAITAGIGDPPLWIAHLRWAGIQQGILLGSPAHLTPHAKALVAASTGSRVAAVMARAGRVWTSVLGGTVDPAAVEAAAEGLASIGLKWDGARLAGHGAARTEDRKIAARLLACARELHPTEAARKASEAAAADDQGETRTSQEELLSDREIEVARLVLQGKTYAEIGEAIFISPRTAEHHIAHIRNRLGATSRSEVLAKLRQLIGEDHAVGSIRPVDSSPVGESPTPQLRVSG